jgi:anaerobic selenocysteine-containing dehydrogenase
MRTGKGYTNNYDAIRDVIGQVIPGFENYNEKVRKPGGFYLPNAPREGRFETEKLNNKAAFTITQLPDNKLAEDEYVLTSIRSHDQFNTTIYGLDDRYRGIHNERRVVFINPKDMQKAGFAEGEKIDLFNYHEGIERAARLFLAIPYDIPEGNVAAYYPETNVLVPINSVALKSNTPTSKYIVVKMRKHVG